MMAQDSSASPVGRQVGPYQVVALLGVGGMGEVYKAVDTRLERLSCAAVFSQSCN